MRTYFLIFTSLFFTSLVCAQTPGQNFCSGNVDGSYFPLDIKKKKIIWSNLYYIETNNGTVTFNGKDYQEFLQEWSQGTVDTLYLREENGITYQLDEITGKETIRLNPFLEKGATWTGQSIFTEYKIVSHKAKLKTPFCRYTNLLAVKATYADGGGTYTFYYLKGYGYVGATTKKGVISYVTPKF